MTRKINLDPKEIEGMANEAIDCCQQICELISQGVDSWQNDTSAMSALAARAGECCERIRSHMLFDG